VHVEKLHPDRGQHVINEPSQDSAAEHASAVVTAPALGEFTIQTDQTRFSLKLATIGTMGVSGGEIAILSTVAPETSIKALRACLHRAAKTEFFANCRGFSPNNLLAACSLGYRFYAAKLGPGTWHSLALAWLPGLICKLTDDSLWGEFQKRSFTTPLLREWVPWLRSELLRLGRLTPLHAFRCEGAVLNLTTEQLDELVSEGLRRKRITI
jgi:hypothetical protein